MEASHFMSFKKDFDSFVNYIKTKQEKDLDLVQFIRFNAPSLILDYDQATHFFLNHEIDRAGNLIIAMNITKKITETKRNHTKNSSEGYQNAYDNYKSHYKEQIRIGKLSDDQKDFYRDYKIFHQIDLTLLEELKFIDERTIKFCQILFDVLGKDETKQYLFALSKDVNKAYAALQKDDRFTEEQKKKFNKLIQKKKNDLGIDWSNFGLNSFCLLDSNSKRDQLIENHLIYYLYSSQAHVYEEFTYENFIVVDPSSLFIKKWASDSALINVKTVFVFTDEWQFKCFDDHFKKRSTSSGFSRSSSVTCCYVEDKTSINNISLKIHEHKNYVCFFNNHFVDNGYKNSVFKELVEKFEPTTVSVFDYDTAFRNNDVMKKSLEKYAAEKIHFFPLKLVDEALRKRKTYAVFRKGDNNGATVIHYSIDKSGEHQGLVPKSFTQKIDGKELFESAHLRSQFNKEYKSGYLKKTDRQRKQAQQFKFTEEILFYYRCSYEAKNESYRVGAYAAKPELTYADRLDDSVKEKILETLKNGRIKSEEEILNWLNMVYPFQIVKRKSEEIDIRKTICKEYKTVFSGKSISLKTLLYFYYDEIQERYGESQFEILWNLANQNLGSIQLDHISIVAIDQSINELYENNDQVNRYQLLSMISSVIDYGIRKRHATINRIKSDVELESARADRAFYQSRENLTIKYFSKSELIAIYQSIKKNLGKDSRNLGAYIKLVTGLESNIVCALQWKDFQLFEDYNSQKDKYQLLIRKQLLNDGSAFSSFSRRESYRKIPCNEELKNILLEEREKQKKRYGYEKEELLNNHAIVEGEDYLLNGITKVLTPTKLTTYCNKMVRKLRKNYSLKTSIPDSKKGTIETDFLNYGGDIFKSNYRHYALYSAGFNSGEIDYLQGKQSEIPFSRNYCDYGNDASQLILLLKQDRLMNVFTKQSLPMAKQMSINNIEEFAYCSDDNPSGTLELTMNIKTDEETALKVTIQNDFGFDIQLTPIKE